MWINLNFVCNSCDHEYDDMVKKKFHEGHSGSFDVESECPECGSSDTSRAVTASGIAAHSIQSREFQREALMTRSRKHSEKLNKKNKDEIEAKWNNGKGAAIG